MINTIKRFRQVERTDTVSGSTRHNFFSVIFLLALYSVVQLK